jgi:hypothetical protein
MPPDVDFGDVIVDFRWIGWHSFIEDRNIIGPLSIFFIGSKNWSFVDGYK